MEYALILALISVVAIAVLKSLGTQVKSAYSTIDSQLNAANTAGAAASPPPFGG